MNKIAKMIVNFSLIVILLVAMIVGNVILFTFEPEVNSVLSPPIVDKEAVELSSTTGQATSRRIMEEGAVLLHNDGTLPLDRQAVKKVNVFGWRSVDWIYGSEGPNASGGVAPEDDDFSKNVDLCKALNAYGVEYNRRLYDMYCNYVEPDHQSANLKGQHISNLVPLREPKIDDKAYYTDDLLSYSKDFSDTAIVVIGRMSGEGMNGSTTSQPKEGPGAITDNTRHFYEISSEEEALLTYCGQNFENVIVLINAANPFECGFTETIPGVDACLYIGFTGTRGASVLPALLYGESSPSGRTVDTFAYDAFTNPGNVFLSQSYTDYDRSYVDMVENVYVGYKWYETADTMGIWSDVGGFNKVVQYPFGYGLSYTTFDWTVDEISVAPLSNITDKTKIEFTVTVTNTGSAAGRDVVEVYFTPPYTPNGIEKASVNLAGYNKTNVLQPGASEQIKIEVDAYDFMSYDCYDKNGNGFKGYELEAGAYALSLRTDSHTVKNVTYAEASVPGTFTYNVENTVKVSVDPITEQPVHNLFTGDEAVDIAPIDSKTSDFDPQIPWFTRTNFPKPSQFRDLFVRRACIPSVKDWTIYTNDRMAAWDAATEDEFGNPVNNTPVTWGASNGLSLTEPSGAISELGKKLGENYNADEWKPLLDQLTIADTTRCINRYYGTPAMNSVGKPSLRDLDGPSQISGFSTAPRGTGYPTMVVIAGTWNPNLAYAFGKSYGDDMKAIGVYGVWGWAIDLHRSSFFGRNHESPSEDPMLCGITITNAVKGLHTRGRYCFLKHFALYGYGGDCTWTTEQALREVYLRPFRKAFVEGGALGCMTTYMGVGGEHSETTVALLTGVLRNEWQFKGSITTDYIGTQIYCDAIIRSGGNLGMGVALTGTYNESSSLRLQNRLRDAMHQVLYMWLHADYLEQQYLANPDANDTIISSTSINSWSWWQPMIASVDVAISVICVLWAALVLISVFLKKKKTDGGDGGNGGDGEKVGVTATVAAATAGASETSEAQSELPPVAAEPAQEEEATKEAETPATEEPVEAEASATEEPAEGAEPPAADAPEGGEAEQDNAKVVFVSKSEAFADEIAALPAEQKEIYEQIKTYAESKPDAKVTASTYAETVKVKSQQLVKFSFKRGALLAMFNLETEDMREMRRSGDVAMKVQPTTIRLTDASSLKAAKKMTDTVYKQIVANEEDKSERKTKKSSTSAKGGKQ